MKYSFFNIPKTLITAITIVVFTIYTMGSVYTSEQSKHIEYLLKSATLYKICKFIDWPENKEQKSFVISVLGQNKNNQKIIIPADKKINNKIVIINEINIVEDIKESSILFIANSEKDKISKILKSIKNKNILTVGDTKGYSEKGVMINFHIENNRINFIINYDIIKKSKLVLHSQLFKVGKVLRTDTE